MLSPGESTTLPRNFSMVAVMIFRQAFRVRMVASSSSLMRRLYPLTSALKTALSRRSKASLLSARGIEREAARLPALKAARHGRDIGVSHLLEAPAREQAPDAPRAKEHDLRPGVGDELGDSHLEGSPARVDGARQGPSLELLPVAHVDEKEGLAAVLQILDFVGVHLGHLFVRLGD